MVNNYGDRCCPLRIGLWEVLPNGRFFMAEIPAGDPITTETSHGMILQVDPSQDSSDQDPGGGAHITSTTCVGTCANQTLSFSKQIYMHVSASTLHMPFCFGKQNTFRYFLHVFVLEGDWAISSTCHVVISKMILSGEFSEGTNLNDRTVNRMLSSTK